MTNDQLQKAFDSLRKKLGSHSAAARTLSISRDHYCAIRNGRVTIPLNTANYIILMASELERGPAPPAPPSAPGTEARA